MEQKIKALLARIVHPESGRNIVESGMVEHIDAGEGRVTVTLRFEKARDPFALKIKRQVEEAIARELSLDREHVAVIVREAAPKAAPAASQHTFTGGIGKVLAVASGKGGVGQIDRHGQSGRSRCATWVTASGILDADIYGPSQPQNVRRGGLSCPKPNASTARDCILPADAMAYQAHVDRLLHQTLRRADLARRHGDQRPAPDDPPDQMGRRWTSCSSDLPPGTGGVHLAVISELKVDGCGDRHDTPAGSRGRRACAAWRCSAPTRSNIPVVGIIENMAWFTPKELPENRYYIFGHGGARAFAEQNDVPFLGRYSDRSIRYGRIGRGASGRGNRSGRRIPLPFDRRKSC